MTDSSIGACILAAGKGTRMHSALPKVLMALLHEPMLAFLYQELDPLFSERLFTVIGHEADMVRAAFPQRENSSFILQDRQLGTGHALQCAWEKLRTAGLSHVLVVNGDTPLLERNKVEIFIKQCFKHDADLAFMTLSLADPGAFGRVLRKNGEVEAIIEAKDYDPALHGPEPREVNAGIYLLRLESLEPLLQRLDNKNKSGEFYITDLIGLAKEHGLRVFGQDMGDDPSLLGINSPLELVRAEELLRGRIVLQWLERGVCIRQPESVRIGPRVRLEPGVQLCGPCELYGETVIAGQSMVDSHCVLQDSRMEEHCHIKNFSHLEQAHVGAHCQVGPYARLRPGAVLEQDARVGNFVEVKKSRLGRGAKAGHLTYLGDAEVGAGSNIGAGTITCNYDGTNKHRTLIGEGAFIGSNSSLVAPVRIGESALVGAGSVITEDVPAGSLALGRGRQINKRRNGSDS